MCSLCQIPMAKNHNFSRILTFWGSCTEPLLPMRVKFGVREAPRADPRYTLTGQTSSECLHCVGFRWPKNHNFGQILTFLGAPVSPPFYRWGPNLLCYSRPAVYAYVPNFVLIVLFCRPLVAKKPNLCHMLPYFGLRHLAVSPIDSSLRKLNTGAQLQLKNVPLSNGIKIVSVLERLHGEIGRTISDVQKRDEQTNKQTN